MESKAIQLHSEPAGIWHLTMINRLNRLDLNLFKKNWKNIFIENNFSNLTDPWDLKKMICLHIISQYWDGLDDFEHIIQNRTQNWSTVPTVHPTETDFWVFETPNYSCKVLIFNGYLTSHRYITITSKQSKNINVWFMKYL